MPVDQHAPRARASGGPNTNVSSSTVASSAYRASSSDTSETRPGSSVRTHASTGGVNKPAAPANTTSTSDETPMGSTPMPISIAALTADEATSTPVWPRRSIRRPRNGAPIAPHAA